HTGVIHSDQARMRRVAALEHAAAAEEGTAEAIWRSRGIGAERVVKGLGDIVPMIDDTLVRVGKHDAGVLVERQDAALQEVTAIEIVCRGPFEVLSARLSQDEVVIGGKADVPGLAEVTDTAILLGVATADVSRTIGRRVVRNDELEVVV